MKETIRVEREKQARARIAKAAGKLPKSLGADLAKLTLSTPHAGRFPEVAAMEQVEAFADLIETLAKDRRSHSEEGREERKALEEVNARLTKQLVAADAALEEAKKERDAAQKALEAALNPPAPAPLTFAQKPEGKP